MGQVYAWPFLREQGKSVVKDHERARSISLRASRMAAGPGLEPGFSGSEPDETTIAPSRNHSIIPHTF
ncbi:MAG: hypothetical protein UV05_C0014G0005 [candidate division CPR1 bacterium GW2011_GWA2_42_17]|uniref:Uncharacterized protein n=1 Tax=candidate division CPR1 bacterium GW2011_GWA2_42_17 TaxID=1618341 RepID=A0A0G0Z5L4_9BACT|nr:MAG: hypothetical protein UV05_C0014G0005 [candidate division CPR1 bacterium GW2011_GWA2_42_17]